MKVHHLCSQTAMDSGGWPHAEAAIKGRCGLRHSILSTNYGTFAAENESFENFRSHSQWLSHATFIHGDVGLRGCVRVLMLVIQRPTEHRQTQQKIGTQKTTIARPSPNFVAMKEGSAPQHFAWFHWIGHPRKPPGRPNIYSLSAIQADL